MSPSAVPIHGRDHCPGGADPISCLTLPTVFRAEQWNNTTTVQNNDFSTVSFDEWTNPNTSVFGEVLDGGGDLIGITLLKAGLVIAKLAWQWGGLSWQTDALLESQGAAIEDNINVWQMETVEMLRVVLVGNDYSFTIMEYYPTIAYAFGHGGNQFPDFRFFLSQKTGANKDAQARATVSYWATS